MIDDPTASDRALSGTRELAKAALPEVTYSGIYEYRVIAALPTGISAIPTRDDMPPLQLVPGAGLLSTLTVLPASMVYVAFINQDPSRPMILSAVITQQILIASLAKGPAPVTITAPMVCPIGPGL